MGKVLKATEDPAKLRLVEETLTDGSAVYNVEAGRDQYGNAAVIFFCRDRKEAEGLYGHLETLEIRAEGQRA